MYEISVFMYKINVFVEKKFRKKLPIPVNTQLSTLLSILKNIVFLMHIKVLIRHFFRHFFRQKILIDIQQIRVIIIIEYEIIVFKQTLLLNGNVFYILNNIM